jgi:plastocyanin
MRSCCALAFLIFATTLAAGCGARTDGAPPLAAPRPAEPEVDAAKVVIDNFAFSPREITVAPGTRVTWINHDDVPHTATSSVRPRAFDSGALDTDDSFSFVFTAPGTYDYFCAVHPHMTGKVIVK